MDEYSRGRADALAMDSSQNNNNDNSELQASGHSSNQSESTQRRINNPTSSDSLFSTRRLHPRSEDMHLMGMAGLRLEFDADDWRMKDRLKTVSCLLCVCLNIGVDPPDPLVSVKPEPCARLECFVDPFRQPAQRSLALIGKTLTVQYEQIQPRARYKQALDPTADDLKRTLLALRRSAKDDRILFHYNGHGVPRPTTSSELWVFNKNYTQYIPVSMHDLKQWIGSPAIYVFDASSAANLFPEISTSNDQLVQDFYLAACGPTETLPLDPQLPADLFTCCLTAPIEASLIYFIANHSQLLAPNIDYKKYATRVPGRIQDRKTPLGELYWIFTAITDTIAFTSLPLPMFKALFRQDLMVAALFRNFLLAQWIMTEYRCTPVSIPALPNNIRDHELWSSWEYVLERLLLQLPLLIPEEPELIDPINDIAVARKNEPLMAPYEPSAFFDDQLSSFECWLKTPPHRNRPMHLPIILQVLLSQHFRFRALVLLCKFLDLGSYAVYHALSVGIFPYILKLLQSPSPDLRLPLVFIWSRIVALSPDSAADLGKESGYQYFVNIFFNARNKFDVSTDIRAMAAFVLTAYARYNSSSLVRGSLHLGFAAHMENDDVFLRQWCILGLRELAGHADDTWGEIFTKIYGYLEDDSDEVRACSVAFLSAYLNRIEDDQMSVQTVVAYAFSCLLDPSEIVRYELVALINQAVLIFWAELRVEAAQYWKRVVDGSYSETKWTFGGDTFVACLWKVLLGFCGDIEPAVSNAAMKVVDCICASIIEVSRKPNAAIENVPKPSSLVVYSTISEIIASGRF